MVTTCVAQGCSSRFNEDEEVNSVAFHDFPQVGPLRQQWTIFVGQSDGWTLKPHHKLCSLHFEESNFERAGHTVHLREGAVPTIFQGSLSHFQKFSDPLYLGVKEEADRIDCKPSSNRPAPDDSPVVQSETELYVKLEADSRTPCFDFQLKADEGDNSNVKLLEETEVVWQLKTEEVDIPDVEIPEQTEGMNGKSESDMSKKRSPNFTDLEKRTLAEEYAKYMPIITGELSANLTTKHKMDAWAKIVGAVNAVAPAHRRLASVKTKWKEMKRETKLRLEENKKEMLNPGAGTSVLQVEKQADTQIGSGSCRGVGRSCTLTAQLLQACRAPNGIMAHPATATVPSPVGEQVLFDGNVAVVDGASDSLRVIHLEVERQATPSSHEELMASICAASAPAFRVDPPAAVSSVAGHDNEPDDPLMAADAPPKKRVRMRRKVEEMKLAVIRNQEVLIGKVGNVVSELKQRNHLDEKLFQLKQEKMRQEAAQHKEVTDIQKQISDSLKELLSRLNGK